MQITVAAKKQAALEAFRAWHNVAIQFPENYSLTFSQFIDWVDRSNPVMRENFGASVIDTQEFLGVQAVTDAMEKLARESKGMVPTYPDGYLRGAQYFGDALIGKIQTWDLSRIKKESLSIAQEGLEKVAGYGKNVLTFGVGAYVLAGAIGLFVVLSSYRKK